MNPAIDEALLDQLVAEAVALSTRRVEEGGIPFAAVVANHRGEILGRGVNQVGEDRDPTAHAEVVAIRNACRHRQSAHLVDALLIASGEPCALCYMTALYAGIGEVVFAVDREGAARGGFDYRASYRLLNRDPADWPLRRHHYVCADSDKPFKFWCERHRLAPAVISVPPRV